MLILLGFGETNRAIAESFAPCVVLDDNFKQESKDNFGNSLLPSDSLEEILRRNPKTTIITSPGIPPHNKMIQTSLKFVESSKEARFLSEYDFFALGKMPPSVWISGTNGKTTTTQMLTHLLKSLGAQSGGNIGTPLARLDKAAKLWILETSSFTLHYTHIAKPILYLLLPITQDHISWHGSYESYIEDKLKPILLLRDKEIAILPRSLESHFLCKKSCANLIFYENAQDLADIFNLDLSKIAFKEPFLLDATLALSACEILFSKQDYGLLGEFKIGAHKIEEFYDKAGNLWVDDSKGTNLDATMEAIKRYRDSKILLILGGDDKGADLSPLFELIAQCEIEIFAIGSNTDKLCKLAKGANKPCEPCYTLEVAVEKIREILVSSNGAHFRDCNAFKDSKDSARFMDFKNRENCEARDSSNANDFNNSNNSDKISDSTHIKDSTKSRYVALLSPAAASLDQFSSYKERGEKFKFYALK